MRAAPGEAYESDEHLESGKLTSTHYPKIRTNCPFDDALKVLSKFEWILVLRQTHSNSISILEFTPFSRLRERGCPNSLLIEKWNQHERQ